MLYIHIRLYLISYFNFRLRIHIICCYAERDSIIFTRNAKKVEQRPEVLLSVKLS